MRLKFQRPPASEDQDTQITEYEANAVEILNLPRKKKQKRKKLKSLILNVTIFWYCQEVGLAAERSC